MEKEKKNIKMRNLKVMMAYRGTNYHGFQYQPNAITVQETVEQALSKLFNESISIQGCSRTDTGVHAKQFCFSMQTENPLPERNIIRGSASYLPEDIAILSVKDVPSSFHARYSCCGKEYMYRIHASESLNPFTTDLELHYRRPVHLSLMREAATYLIGEHDFAAFSANAPQKTNTIRTIHNIRITQEEDTVIFKIRGNGFLYNMVRIIIGTLLEINEGRIFPNDIDTILDSRDRKQAGSTALPHGLYLNRVFYDNSLDDYLKSEV